MISEGVFTSAEIVQNKLWHLDLLPGNDRKKIINKKEVAK
jgi:hypothetical protein